MKKINGRSVTGNKGSCLICWMFGNYLENLGKSTESAKNKHLTSSEVLKIFRNRLWKTRKMSQSAKNNLPAFCDFFLNLRKSLMEVFGNLRKFSKIVWKCLKQPCSRKNGKMSESSENDIRKCSEMLGKLRNSRKIFKCNRNLWIPISDTCGLKIRFKNFDL